MINSAYKAYVSRFNRFMADNDLSNLSSGRIHCPECKAEWDDEECPNGHGGRSLWDGPWFSHSPCDCCRTHLAGDRMHATGYSKEHGIMEFDVCPDCVYFAEYGKLDDQTMLDVEKDAARPDRDKLCASLGLAPGSLLPNNALGYPVIYLSEDQEAICPDCANGENGSRCLEDDARDDPQWNVVKQMPHMEGPPVVCDHCNAEVESAYGDPDDEEAHQDKDKAAN